MSTKKLKVINLFGAPGKGKSAARSGLFWLMKAHHLSVEEVSEYAKYLVLTGRTWQLQEEQLYLFAKQHHKQLIVEKSGYEFAATDSPLQLCAFYSTASESPEFAPLVDSVFERFENLNFFLTRDTSRPDTFEERGRMHTNEQSDEVEIQMREFLKKKNVSYVDVPVDIFTPWRILDHIKPGLATWPCFPGKASS